MNAACKLLVILFLANMSFAASDGEVECQSYDSEHLGREVKYCVQRSHPEVTASNERVVYFFHGMKGNSGEWKSKGYAEALNQLTNSSEVPPMTVVSFDTDGQSFFTDYGNNHTGSRSYETWLTEEFMPFIENTYHVCNERKCRATAGFSMGGLGAIKTALRHPDLFAVGAGSCPALPPFNAFDSDSQWGAYFSRHPIGGFKGFFLLDIIRSVFASRSVFDQHDPSVITENWNQSVPFPAMYFDVGGKDTYGFQEGVARFQEILDRKGFKYKNFYDPNAAHDIYKKQAPVVVSFLRDSLI